MDLSIAVAALAQETAAKEKELSTRKFFLVAPVMDKTPADDGLIYAEVSKVADLNDLPEGTVLLFRDPFTFLEAIASYEEIFDVHIKALTNIPGVVYPVAFDSRVWRIDKISYGTLMGQMALVRETEKVKQTEAITDPVHDREKRQFTRKDGTVKHDKSFRLNGEDKDDVSGQDAVGKLSADDGVSDIDISDLEI